MYMENIQDWILSIRKSKYLILVEGIKDKKALTSLGLKNIMTIKKPLFEVVEEISDITNKCILLLDLDKEGRKLYSYFKKNLQRQGVKIDDRYREFLYKNTEITNIECIKKYATRQETRIY